jgi:hypothetical protein
MNIYPKRPLHAERWPDPNHPMRIWLLPGQLDALVSDDELAEHFVYSEPVDRLIVAAQRWAASPQLSDENRDLLAAVHAYNAAGPPAAYPPFPPPDGPPRKPRKVTNLPTSIHAPQRITDHTAPGNRPSGQHAS